MRERALVAGAGSGALAGLVAGVPVALWTVLYPPGGAPVNLLELVDALWGTLPAGILGGGLAGAVLVRYRAARARRLATWVTAGALLSVIAVGGWLGLLLLLWLGARLGISSAGEPADWSHAFALLLLVGALAGCAGGFVGGRLYIASRAQPSPPSAGP